MKTGLVIAIALAAASAHSYTIFDGDFASGNWTSILAHTGSGSAVILNPVSGGNPGTAIDLQYNAISQYAGGFYIFDTAQAYNPSTQGAIGTVDFSHDRYVMLHSGSFSISDYDSLAIRQNGKTYFDDSDNNSSDLNTWLTFSGNGFAATRFAYYDLPTGTYDPTQHPDFGPSAGTIEFGILGVDTTPRSGVQLDLMYDNFSVTVNPVPEPASLCVLALGIVGAISKRRRA